MLDGVLAFISGIGVIIGSVFDLDFAGTNLGYVLIAFFVVGAVCSFLFGKFLGVANDIVFLQDDLSSDSTDLTVR